MYRPEDISDEVLGQLAMILWVVFGRTDPGVMPDENGLRSIAANVLNARECETTGSTK